MKRKFKKAYTALGKIGAPVFEHEDMNGNFGLSAENNYDRIWADYYREFGWPVDGIDAEVLKMDCILSGKIQALYTHSRNKGKFKN